jgi:hypothetical protein
MKSMLPILATCTAIALITTGCATCLQHDTEPGIMGNRNDPYMYWICAYFKEANGRWPTNTPDLVSFLQNDYTNMLYEIEFNYKSTKYTTSPEGMLILSTYGPRFTEKKYVSSSAQCSADEENK